MKKLIWVALVLPFLSCYTPKIYTVPVIFTIKGSDIRVTRTGKLTLLKDTVMCGWQIIKR